ncbi:MAG: hypothetical protein QM778_12070 [Myxococcales bacterium]
MGRSCSTAISAGSITFGGDALSGTTNAAYLAKFSALGAFIGQHEMTIANAATNLWAAADPSGSTLVFVAGKNLDLGNGAILTGPAGGIALAKLIWP